MTLIPILAVLYFTTIFFAGEPIWVYTLAELFILVGSFVFLLVSTIRSVKTGSSPLIIYKDPVTLFGILFLLLVCFQLIPLPPALIKALSPMSLEIWEKAPLPPGSYFPISIHPYATKHGLIFGFCLLLVYFWVLYGIKTRNQMEHLIVGILVLGALHGLYGLLETVTGNNHILWVNKIFARDSITGTFPNRNQFATFLSMIWLLGLGYFWFLMGEVKSRKDSRLSGLRQRMDEWTKGLGPKRIATFLSLLIILFVLLATASRGGNLSTLAALILVATLIYSQTSRLKGGKVFLIIIVLLVSFSMYFAGERLWERLARPELNIQDRLEMTRDTLSLHRDFPIFGSGHNAFFDIFTRYAKESPNLLYHTHNDWVEALAVTGWIGFFIILAGAVTLFLIGIKALNRLNDRLSQGFLVGGLGALLSVSLHSLTDYSLHKTANALIFATILGILTKGLYGFYQTGKTSNKPVGRSTVHNYSNIQGIILLITLLVTSAWCAGPVLRLFVMNRIIPIDSDVITEWPDSGLGPVIRAIRLNPDDRISWYWLAQTLSNHEISAPDSDFQKVEAYRQSGWGVGNSTLTNQILFCIQEALARRPSSWFFWKFLANQAREKTAENPALLEPLTAKAYDMAIFLNPNNGQDYFNRGVFWLSRFHPSNKTGWGKWGPDFRRSLELNPKLGFDVIGELTRFDYNDLIDEAVKIFPQKAEAWMRAGEALLEKGRLQEMEFLLRRGETLKIAEIEILIKKIRRSSGKGNLRQAEKLLNELHNLDQDNPYYWYTRGNILRSMKNAHIRGALLSTIDLPDNLRVGLSKLKIKDEKEELLVQFYLSLLDIEEKKYTQAARKLDRILSTSPNYFPALLAQEKMLMGGDIRQVDEKHLKDIQKRIDLFSMEEIPQGSWIKNKREEKEQKIFEAAYRNRAPVNKLNLHLPYENNRWVIYVDGRLEKAGVSSGIIFQLHLSAPLPTGEHIVRLEQIKTRGDKTSTPDQLKKISDFAVF